MLNQKPDLDQTRRENLPSGSCSGTSLAQVNRAAVQSSRTVIIR